MASLATVYNRILGATRDQADSQPHVRQEDQYQLRALPNEDIYFFVKEISNARVVPQADPKARTAAWRVVWSGGAVAACIIAVLLPSACGLMAGYKIEALKADQQKLLQERSRLELEESALLNPARLEELARNQYFVDPAPQRVIYLDERAGSLALNVEKK